MTKEQRQLVRYWIIGGGLIFVVILTSLLGIEHQQSALLVLCALFGIISAFQDFSYYKGYGSERNGLSNFIDSHPKLKSWLIGFCIVALPYFINKIQIDDRVSGIYYFWSLVLLLGPIIAISEIERFRSLGNPNA